MGQDKVDRQVKGRNLDNTIAQWSAFYGRPITPDEAKEILDNVIALELLLRKLRKKYG
ncbi:MAG: hypothetical protein UY62_C0030G0003 [Parcubacteria group bacterium GW2011_GWF2_50_9]|nr:MAG: hypothetical protein UY62_C0030G0003 [Parcubacteria group bacterium GW2011_GWF2_50_9]